MISRHSSSVVALGLAQTLAWASSYYLLAILAAPMSRDLGCTVPTVFAALSVALLVAACLGPFAGRAIDRWGGRSVLMGTNIVFAAGLAILGSVHGVVHLFAAWIVLGIAMGSGLYEAAFASLVRLYGRDSRNAITGVTLFAGFASTVGWPLTTWLESHLGWREACLSWALLHLVVGLPLNWVLPTASTPPVPAPPAKPVDAIPLRTGILLATVFAIIWFISTSMAAHLPRLLVASGATLAAAVTANALIGPAQVGGRLLEFGFLRHVHPLLSARLATLMHSVGAVSLLIFGAPVVAVFAVFHGLGNGILTIAMGTLPLALFGPAGYGKRQGLLMAPARVVQASAPWLFGLGLDRWGVGTLWLSSGLGLIACLVLLLIPAPRRQVDPIVLAEQA